MTEAEKVICRLYLEDMDRNHTCNEYRLLMELLDREPCEDAISRQAAIDALELTTWYHQNRKGEMVEGANSQEDQAWYKAEDVYKVLNDLPSAQPERTCVNCGRTANNGGWYADGGTRCPIEEHYALPKDGYCHLWEKRNVTDDDYPERRTDGRD